MFCQNIFISYKSGNKFGLCDETGKIVLAPKYDNVKYLQKDFFKYENYKIQYDTAKSFWGDIVLQKLVFYNFYRFHICFSV